MSLPSDISAIDLIAIPNMSMRTCAAVVSVDPEWELHK